MKAAIKAEQLTKRFGDFIATNAITFEVEPGEIFGFLGANGAGKTTAMRMLTGLLKPSSGNAWVGGYNVRTETERLKRGIGYMSQKFSMYPDLTVSQNFVFYGGVYGLEKPEINRRLEELLEQFNLQGVRNELVSALPLGWKQKLSFGLSMVHRPAVVFLDEPTGGVDPITRRQFWDLIYEAVDRGVTVLVTTHFMDEAEYCNRVSIMVDGSIRALDTPSDLKKTFGQPTMDGVFQVLARGTSSK